MKTSLMLSKRGLVLNLVVTLVAFYEVFLCMYVHRHFSTGVQGQANFAVSLLKIICVKLDYFNLLTVITIFRGLTKLLCTKILLWLCSWIYSTQGWSTEYSTISFYKIFHILINISIIQVTSADFKYILHIIIKLYKFRGQN
jgi:hypothetical protein